MSRRRHAAIGSGRGLFRSSGASTARCGLANEGAALVAERDRVEEVASYMLTVDRFDDLHDLAVPELRRPARAVLCDSGQQVVGGDRLPGFSARERRPVVAVIPFSSGDAVRLAPCSALAGACFPVPIWGNKRAAPRSCRIERKGRAPSYDARGPRRHVPAHRGADLDGHRPHEGPLHSSSQTVQRRSTAVPRAATDPPDLAPPVVVCRGEVGVTSGRFG